MERYFQLIAFSHTIFALPFAMLGMTIGFVSGSKDLEFWLSFKIILCMLFARSAAMAFNRYLDRHIDLKNARTEQREIPSGKIAPNSALIFVLCSSLFFIITTFTINKLCFYLSPVALLIILGYSYTKRFTPLCHLILGIGLGLAPVGAYVAVTGMFDSMINWIGVAVMCWVAGFDIVYALQDEEFDKKNGLFSIPVTLGKANALKFSELLHLACALLMIIVSYYLSLQYQEINYIWFGGLVIFISLLIYQHSIISITDLSRINRAFFTTNGIASILFCALGILDLLI